jgi:hypothetical protein
MTDYSLNTEHLDALRTLGIEPNNVRRMAIVLEPGQPPLILVEQYGDSNATGPLIDAVLRGEYALVAERRIRSRMAEVTGLNTDKSEYISTERTEHPQEG